MSNRWSDADSDLERLMEARRRLRMAAQREESQRLSRQAAATELERRRAAAAEAQRRAVQETLARLRANEERRRAVAREAFERMVRQQQEREKRRADALAELESLLRAEGSLMANGHRYRLCQIETRGKRLIKRGTRRGRVRVWGTTEPATWTLDAIARDQVVFNLRRPEDAAEWDGVNGAHEIGTRRRRISIGQPKLRAATGQDLDAIVTDLPALRRAAGPDKALG